MDKGNSKVNKKPNLQSDFLVEDPNKGEPVTPCMDVYKANIQSDGILDKLKLRIVVGGDLQNKELVGETCSPTSSMSTFKYFFQRQLSTSQEFISYISLEHY